MHQQTATQAVIHGGARWAWVALILGGLGSMAWADTSSPATPAKSADGELNAPDDVLVRIGDLEVITQRDFAEAIRRYPAKVYESRKNLVMRDILHERYLRLYLLDHPDLVPEKMVDARLERNMKIMGYKSREEFGKALAKKGDSLSRYREQLRDLLARTELARPGIEAAKDEDYMRKVFEESKRDFDGSTVTARHLYFHVVPYHTPEERSAMRDKLMRMRADIIAGHRTWEQCVAQTDSAYKEGTLGEFTRHRMKNEFIAEACFNMKVGQISGVVETPLGYHVFQVLDRKEGHLSFEDVTKNIARWLEIRGYVKALAEAMAKFEVVGVKPPTRPPGLGAWETPDLRRPATQATTTQPAPK